MKVTKVKKFKLKRRWPWQKKRSRWSQERIGELCTFILREVLETGPCWIIMSPDLAAMLMTLPIIFIKPVKDTLGEYTMEPTGSRVTLDMHCGGKDHQLYAMLRPYYSDKLIILNCGDEKAIIGHDIGNAWESNDGCKS